MNTKIQKEVEEILSRGVASFVDPDGKFKEKLTKKASGEYKKDIVIKLGADPNRPDIHLGHAVILRKLRQLQNLGCKIVFLVGDYTAQIGDPTGVSKVRPEIEQKEVDENAKTYIEQVGKILLTDPKVFSWIRNSDWFYGAIDLVAPPNIKSIKIEINKGKEKTTLEIPPDSFVGKSIYYESTRMQRTHLKNQRIYSVSLRGLLWTLRHITHSQLIQRDMFQERIKKGQELYMHELLYPVLQGIDSSTIANIYGSCDLEIGGTDQHFNMLVGRDVMKANKQESQAVMSLKILDGLDGKEKMSKSLDNYVGITEASEIMFGKIMSIPDSSIVNYFELCTYMPKEDVQEVKKDLDMGKKNPVDIKMRLAKDIVAIYHGDKKAEGAQENFIKVFREGAIPDSLEEIELSPEGKLVDVLLEKSIVDSKTEWRRLVKEGAVWDVEKKIKITEEVFSPKEPIVLRIGKKRFVKVIPK